MRLFTKVAVIWLILCITFVLANLIVVAIQAAAPSRPLPIVTLTPLVSRLYPDMSVKDATDLLSETWTRPLEFDTFTVFKERPYRGKYVNVSEDGFRVGRDQGPWPPDRKAHFVVFVFGGSTAFGYGVADKDTIPSYLQQLLPRIDPGREVRVYNFGRGFYYSSQERILFEKLILADRIPDLAVFIDGLNEFLLEQDEPASTQGFRATIRTPGWAAGLAWLPFSKFAIALRNRIRERQTASASVSGDFYNRPKLFHKLLQRYLDNKQMIENVAQCFSIPTLFVWQPVPTYKYDIAYHIAPVAFSWRVQYTKYAYPMMAEIVARGEVGPICWCADIQQDVKKPLYVDFVHYNPELSRMTAACIADKFAKIGPGFPSSPIRPRGRSKLTSGS
jgi:hypothetical protein